MNENIQSLWGDLPEVDDSARTPHQILREQAMAITQLTGGALKGRISKAVTLPPKLPVTFAHSLWIEAPSLGGYSVRVAGIDHPVEMYPLKLEDALSDIELDCSSESEFIDGLRKVLQSEKLRKLISALMLQIRGTETAVA